ncbi:MAG: hypothetical protein E7271_04095 [Lachnospiraceae bacterium]|jgi:hypothetical protein|nr:hypothetical protein [Lachnospiraceae bacterium]
MPGSPDNKEKEADKKETEAKEPDKKGPEKEEAKKQEPEKKEEQKVEATPPKWEPSKTPSAKEVEIEARMRVIEAEMERLKKERIAFEEERKRFEAERESFEKEKKAYQKGVEMAQEATKMPEIKTPEALEADKKNNAEPEKAKPKKDAVVNSKGNYTEMNLGDSALTEKQSSQTAKLKITADMTVLAKKSSKEFKMMQKAVERFDKFMKGMEGRTAFTPEELEKYDKLSHDVYKASDEYLKKKENDMEKRAPGKDGKKKQSNYEYSRVKAAEEIRETVEKMRQEMLDKAFKAKVEEMDKRCKDQVQNLENSRNKMANDKKIEPDKMKERLADNTARTIFYQNRMQQLSKNNDLCMKPGESMNAAINRLNSSIIPTKDEIDGIKKHPVAGKIVENGVKSLADGKTFSNNDINKTVKAEASKKAPEVKKAKEMKKEQVKQKEKQAQKQAQKQTQKTVHQKGIVK